MRVCNACEHICCVGLLYAGDTPQVIRSSVMYENKLQHYREKANMDRDPPPNFLESVLLPVRKPIPNVTQI